MTETYDGSTTALRRLLEDMRLVATQRGVWSRRWKTLAKALRVRFGAALNQIDVLEAAYLEGWRQRAEQRERIAELETEHDSVSATLDAAQTRIAQAVAELEHDDYPRHAAKRALEILRMSCDNPDCDDACKRLHGPPAAPPPAAMPEGWEFSPGHGGVFRSVDLVISLKLIRELLAGQGLRIVGEADVKVLEAIDAMPMSAFGMFASSPGPAWKPLLAAIRELLARRAQQKEKP